jgi:hypothetical protein
VVTVSNLASVDHNTYIRCFYEQCGESTIEEDEEKLEKVSGICVTVDELRRYDFSVFLSVYCRGGAISLVACVNLGDVTSTFTSTFTFKGFKWPTAQAIHRSAKHTFCLEDHCSPHSFSISLHKPQHFGKTPYNQTSTSSSCTISYISTRKPTVPILQSCHTVSMEIGAAADLAKAAHLPLEQLP